MFILCDKDNNIFTSNIISVDGEFCNSLCGKFQGAQIKRDKNYIFLKIKLPYLPDFPDKA